jgi:hypothetical protein
LAGGDEVASAHELVRAGGVNGAWFFRSERTREREREIGVGEVVRAWLSLLQAGTGDIVALHARVGEPHRSLPLTPVGHEGH